MPRDGDTPVMVQGFLLIAKTQKALGVTTDTRDEAKAHPRLQKPEAWIALSLVEDTNLNNVGDVGYVVLPKWLAEKEEWNWTEA